MKGKTGPAAGIIEFEPCELPEKIICIYGIMEMGMIMGTRRVDWGMARVYRDEEKNSQKTLGMYVKSSARVLANYSISVLLFIIFLYAVISLAKNNTSTWLAIYSFVVFLLCYALIYSDMKKLAIKERKPQYKLKPYPVKGFVYGIIGFLPFIILEITYLFIIFDDSVLNRIKHALLNTVMGPLYWCIKLFSSSFIGYAVATSIVPVIAGFAYMMGYFGWKFPGIPHKARKPEKPGNGTNKNLYKRPDHINIK